MLVTRIDSFSIKREDGTIDGVVWAKANDQWITWNYAMFQGKDTLRYKERFDSDSMNCYAGHYFAIPNTALADFTTRINKLKGVN